MKKEIYDHVLRVWPPVRGDLRVGPAGMFGAVNRTSRLFYSEGSTVEIASGGLPATDSKNRWLSNAVVELHFVHLYNGPGYVLPPSEMETMVAAQMRVIVKVNDAPHQMHATFAMPSSTILVAEAAGEARVAIPRDACVEVVAHLRDEVIEHLNGMVRDASGKWTPGDPGMLRIIRVSMTLEHDD